MEIQEIEEQTGVRKKCIIVHSNSIEYSGIKFVGTTFLVLKKKSTSNQYFGIKNWSLVLKVISTLLILMLYFLQMLCQLGW